MDENPRSTSDQARTLKSAVGETQDRADVLKSTQTFEDVTEIARELAAHGGGPASFDLALDLALHDAVGQARDVAGATGAAIALARDGEMVCRATTGENAPDLGVRVETTSGLVGACLGTGETQYCRDAETDPKVNREACRRLGVRSMVVIPLSEINRIFGLLEVFSSSPNAFGDKEIALLQLLARRVADSTQEVQRARPDPGLNDLLHAAREQEVPSQGPDLNGVFRGPESSREASGADGIWTSVLFVLVIAVAVSLGIVVGWSVGVKTRTHTAPAKPVGAGLESAQKAQPPSNNAAESSLSGKSSIAESAGDANSLAVPDGGLLVTQNGKVIYRSFAGSATSSTSQAQARARPDQAERRLIHRVEPDYPPDARAKHVEGTVVLDAEIQPSGEVGNVVVVSGDPLLAEAAVQAVKQWRYQPVPGAGQDLRSQTRISMKFVLPPT